VPCFDDFYATAVERLQRALGPEPEIVDLGAGTGLLSFFVAEAMPGARFTLVDVSEEMLSRARARFAASAHRFTFVVADFGGWQFPSPCDAVISALAIHHLEDGEKQALFARIHAALRPGGIFVNADQMLGTTPTTEAIYDETWLRGARARGVPENDLAAAIERMRADRTATLEDQLAWLRRAGFADVDCWFKHYRFAVYSGMR
jgi:tRNA (cmo5U34)-methyltransferase